MKKITFLLLTFLCSYSGYSQFTEGFEGASFPPTGWLVTDNGVGTTVSWIRSNTQPVNSGVWAAYMNRENVGPGNTSQDWLITNQLGYVQQREHKLFDCERVIVL